MATTRQVQERLERVIQNTFAIHIEHYGYDCIGVNVDCSSIYSLHVYTKPEKVLLVPALRDGTLLWMGAVEYDENKFRKLCAMDEKEKITASSISEDFLQLFIEDCSLGF